jgi:hypothetical protein
VIITTAALYGVATLMIKRKIVSPHAVNTLRRDSNAKVQSS